MEGLTKAAGGTRSTIALCFCWARSSRQKSEDKLNKIPFPLLYGQPETLDEDHPGLMERFIGNALEPIATTISERSKDAVRGGDGSESCTGLSFSQTSCSDVATGQVTVDEAGGCDFSDVKRFHRTPS